MKKINFFTILSISLLLIGSVLMVFENHTGDWLTVSGAIIGLYTCYLMDMQEWEKYKKEI